MKKEDLKHFFASQDGIRRFFAVWGNTKLFSEYMELDRKTIELAEKMIMDLKKGQKS
jgi:hypothetical protein